MPMSSLNGKVRVAVVWPLKWVPRLLAARAALDGIRRRERPAASGGEVAPEVVGDAGLPRGRIADRGALAGPALASPQPGLSHDRLDQARGARWQPCGPSAWVSPACTRPGVRARSCAQDTRACHGRGR